MCLHVEFSIAGKALLPFMYSSVAVRFDHEQFWKSLKRLCDEFAIAGQDLPTLVNGSVTTQLHDEVFWNSEELRATSSGSLARACQTS